MYSEPKDDVEEAEVLKDDSSIYEVHGYKDREDYLQSLADEYGVSIDTVKTIAETLGETEDFDGLVTALPDITE